MLKRFTKNELLAVLTILLAIILASYFNLNAAEARARDAQRRADLKSVAEELQRYFDELGFYPPSSPDGRIIACKGDNFDKIIEEQAKNENFDLNLYFEGLIPCSWGKDKLSDLEPDETVFIPVLPNDPFSGKGFKYFYISDTHNFQLYGYLEGGQNEEGYNVGIVNRNLVCGVNSCSFGVANGSTPLDMRLEEYENKINRD